MAINRKRMLAALNEANKALKTRIRNSRTGRRVRNEDDNQEVDFGDLGIDDIGGGEEEAAEDEGGEAEGDTVSVMIDPEEIEDRIMDALEDAFDEPVEAIEVVDDEEAPAEDEGEDEAEAEAEDEGDEEEITNNCRRYRRVKNARIVRNADGTKSVLIPVASKAKTKKCVQNSRRRVVKNADVAGIDIGAPFEVTTKNGIATFKYSENARRRKLASLINKANKYDALQVRASVRNALNGIVGNTVKDLANSIKAGLKQEAPKAIDEALNTMNTRRGVRRYKNYRLVRNEDGGIEVEIAVAPEGGVTVDVDTPAVDMAPVSDIAPVSDVDVTVDGEPVTDDEMEMIKNYRHLRKIRNARAMRSTAIRNESSEVEGTTQSFVHDTQVVMNEECCGGPLEVPSTFPEK